MLMFGTLVYCVAGVPISTGARVVRLVLCDACVPLSTGACVRHAPTLRRRTGARRLHRPRGGAGIRLPRARSLCRRRPSACWPCPKKEHTSRLRGLMLTSMRALVAGETHERSAGRDAAQSNEGEMDEHEPPHRNMNHRTTTMTTAAASLQPALPMLCVLWQLLL